MGCRSSVAAVDDPRKDAAEGCRTAKGRQPDVPQINAIDLSEESTDDASNNSLDASGETVDPVDSTEVPSSMPSQEFMETPPIQPPLLRNFLESDELFDAGVREDACTVERPPHTSSLHRGIDVDNHAAIARLVGRLHQSLLDSGGLDSAEEAAEFAREVPPRAWRKQKGLKVSFSDGSPEVRYIEGLQARREELRLWDIAEFLEMRREAMSAAGMVLDDYSEATSQMSYIVNPSDGWATASQSFHQPTLGDSESRMPAFSLFWCCSSAPPDAYSPFAHELENDCLRMDSEAVPSFPERQHPPCSFSPRQAVAI
jgi:hypothetical protein